MSRPTKQGLDYFPLCVGLDDKFDLIEAQFGLKGFAVVVKLFQKIYGGYGYYCEWTNDIALVFSNKIGLNAKVVSDIVEASIRRGIFDKDIFDKYGVLTSKGIQTRYLEAVSRRKNIKIKKQYSLVKFAQNSDNVNVNPINVDINSINADINPQSKVKEKKVNKKKIVKEKNSNFGVGLDGTQNTSDSPPPPTSSALSPVTQVLQYYEQHLARIPSQRDRHEITDWLEDVDADVVTYAIDEAVNNGAYTWAYARAVLNSHFAAGRTTLDAILKWNEIREQRNTAKEKKASAEIDDIPCWN